MQWISFFGIRSKRRHLFSSFFLTVKNLYDVVILAIISCIIIWSFATRTEVMINKAFFKLRLFEMLVKLLSPISYGLNEHVGLDDKAIYTDKKVKLHKLLDAE